MKWAPRRSSDQLQQQPPGCKWGHTCNAVRNLIYIFGGYGRDECQTNDVHVFDIGTYTWSKPVMKGTHPSPRDSHSSTAVGSKLYVFGGTDGTSPLDDLFVLDTATNTWGKPDVFGDVPAPREGHSASLIGDNLFVFGGCGKSSDPSEEEYYNDLHVLNTKTMAWREVKTTGAELMPRAGHTTISHGKYLVVFGGFSDDRKLFNDVHTLDLTTGVWATSNPSGPGPSPRFSLAGDSVDAERGILFFYGGCNEELEALDDMYFLDTGWLLLLLTLLFFTIWLPFFCEEMLREKDPSEPKLSMRKELKRRRQEYRATPFVLDKQRDADKSLVSSHGGICGKPWTSPIFPCQTHATEFQAHVQPLGEKMFEARVSDVFNYGYTLEASIDGKLFRGLLFSYKPGFAQAVQSYMARFVSFEPQLLSNARKENITGGNHRTSKRP
ncbi:rab9 effector protein with kelch motifs [Selaginella moellendorffii]|uniref:rab9 effector protein with kelch motifs n=1 Tax=Selaginella moellendorffii TaxID=88036 RepID=UPI000D1C5E9F|nr:rab9 effector protein with kelch motifs [Selaginella moellendorffii]|eukprot:XP_024544514.1 rab9 effector protein with kelch motifs [Selaginella moellendorffii]